MKYFVLFLLFFNVAVIMTILHKLDTRSQNNAYGTLPQIIKALDVYINENGNTLSQEDVAELILVKEKLKEIYGN